MAGYKKKPATKKRAPVRRKAPIRRAPMTAGTNLLVNAYFEAHKALDANNESVMAYSICIDPKVGAIKGNAVTFKDGGDGNGANIADGTNLSYGKYNMLWMMLVLATTLLRTLLTPESLTPRADRAAAPARAEPTRRALRPGAAARGRASALA